MASYSGLGEYAFVSYSHKNSTKVLDVVNRLIGRGVHIWYDENLTPSDEYIEVIAKKVEACSFFIAFLSKDSMNSRYCRDEVRFAYEKEKPMMIIYVEDCELTPGYKMMLNGVQFYKLGNEVNRQAIDSIMEGIPHHIVDKIQGEKIFENNKYAFYFKDRTDGRGFIIERIDKADGSAEEVYRDGFPPASEYTLNYITRSHGSGNRFSINVTVVWDFTYTYYREDEYFEETYNYALWGAESEKCSVTRTTLEKYDYNSGERTKYNYVDGVNTVSNTRDDTMCIKGLDRFGNWWNVTEKFEEKK